MMAYGGVEAQLLVFLISALHGSDWSASPPNSAEDAGWATELG